MSDRPIDLTTVRSRAFYVFARFVAAALFVAPWRVVVRGREHLPASGAYIIAPSHRSILDIPWASRVTKRRVRFIGKASLYRVPVLGWIFTHLGGFSVERDGSDRAPLRAALSSLEAGDVIAIFPEGTRQSGDLICELQPGAAYLAIKAQVPVVPVALIGTEHPIGTGRIPRLSRGRIVIGEPLAPPPLTSSVVKRELVNAFTAELHATLQRLYDEARR